MREYGSMCRLPDFLHDRRSTSNVRREMFAGPCRDRDMRRPTFDGYVRNQRRLNTIRYNPCEGYTNVRGNGYASLYVSLRYRKGVSVDRTDERVRDLLSAAFLLRAPVTVETEGATYADTYVIAVVDAEETAGDAFVLLSRTNEQQDAIGVTVDRVTGVTGIGDDDVRRAALLPAT